MVSGRHPRRPEPGLENVSFNNWGWGGVEINQPVRYGKGVAVDPELVNTFDRNIYWNPFSTKIFTNGSYCNPELDLAQWQKLSGQDLHSKWLDPLDHPQEMPRWFKERFSLKGDLRPIHQVLTELIPSVKEGVAKTVLMSRLLRSKRVEPVKFADPMFFGLYYDAEGKRCASVWSRARRSATFWSAAPRLTVENKYLVRKEAEAVNGRLSLFVDESR